MPKPNKNESKQAYISRAVEHFMEKEKKTQKQAVGAAYGFWKTYHKESKRGK